jgi:hypothetical protein
VAIGTTKFFGQLNALVQGNAPRHIEAMFHFKNTHPHRSAFNRRNFSHAAIEQGQDEHVQF